MTQHAPIDVATHEWQSCSVILPRFVKFLSRNGMRTRLIMPGRYEFRRSRTHGYWLYRNPQG
ncbi:MULTISPECIES: hypothetical protein [unclassified Sphingopyxis]|uniref:hypothetical protein n=1 Tax=unclassified Sphingopyxis TaxID=2614943 RepID=UPI000730A265|nr:MULTISPECIES: hypothetical protein [unclassified Sphingopyxis]KTE26600.1 hypothetical protein ATE61_07730 [Sphingopyxis sp. H057]KTE53006.1 hypothetical protein ATE64_10175 [Sphingopyxis sp. H073]KTE55196.1 hypothetical protein ATE69_10150 [Sphingopyxis sp. H071]KTE58685.1 hypothetical protein ATE66_13980 [Sphingopyxis sp. H107]KTE64050.1 hypothetical protein ATE65_12815 [Sphingopyxis sp. H100]